MTLVYIFCLAISAGECTEQKAVYVHTEPTNIPCHLLCPPAFLPFLMGCGVVEGVAA